jgi:hypothetical protein
MSIRAMRSPSRRCRCRNVPLETTEPSSERTMTDLDSGPAIIPLAEAHRLVVGAHAGPLLRPVSPYLVFAVQPANVVVGPVESSLTSATRASTSWLL